MRPYVYVHCPSCRKQIAQPFARAAIPHAVTHDCGARLVVIPAEKGNRHRVKTLSRAQRFEDVIAREVA